MQLNDMKEWNIQSFAVTGFDDSDYTYSAPGTKLYVMVPDDEMVARASELIDSVMAGMVITEADVSVE